MIELVYAEKSASETGRGFTCKTCPERIRKLRRCEEDKQFTSEDGAMWPMQIQKGGDLFNFCPGKATWDSEAASIFNTLIITAETGALLYNGSINDQPNWYIDLLGWFLPRMDSIKFMSKAKSILGDGGSGAVANKMMQMQRSK